MKKKEMRLVARGDDRYYYRKYIIIMHFLYFC